METGRQVNAFPFCRNMREQRKDAIDCARFGVVASCAPCSVCPKCGDTMILGDINCDAIMKYYGDLEPVAACRLCGFRKHPGEASDAKIIEPPKTNEEESVGQNRIGKCVECLGTKTIIGRGLCGGCYARNQKAGTLDKFQPGMGGKPSKSKPVTKTKEEKPVSVIHPETKVAEAAAVKEPESLEAFSRKFLESSSRSLIEVATVSKETRPLILLLRDDDRDQKLLEWIEKRAYNNRREVGCEIVSILEQAMGGG